MLYRAPVAEVKAGRVNRRYGYLAIVMQYYPRFLGKELTDAYLKSLAPDKSLFTEFKALELASDHDAAFEAVKYQSRFEITPAGWKDLEALAGISSARDVFLICQCNLDQRCHADLLLLAAQARFNARIPTLRKAYPEFSARLCRTA